MRELWAQIGWRLSSAQSGSSLQVWPSWALIRSEHPTLRSVDSAAIVSWARGRRFYSAFFLEVPSLPGGVQLKTVERSGSYSVYRSASAGGIWDALLLEPSVVSTANP